MRYGVSIGRRQPMHRLHAECIREIVDNWLDPIIIVGSTNSADSALFDPLKNPLTFAQEEAQIRAALPFLQNPIILPLPDVGDLERWCAAVVALLGDKLPESTMHYRTKTSQTTANPAIQSLEASEPVFARLGLKSWKTVNKNPADDAVNSTTLRNLPLNAPEFQKQLAAPSFITALIESARAENPDGAWLTQSGLPLSMLDLTLSRLWKEASKPSKTLLPEGNLTLEAVQAALKG